MPTAARAPAGGARLRFAASERPGETLFVAAATGHTSSCCRRSSSVRRFCIGSPPVASAACGSSPTRAFTRPGRPTCWRHGSLPLRHGQGGYGILYPLLIGAPLSAGTVAQGYAALKLLQAFVVSLAAVPVFMLGRRLMADRYALVASVLTVAAPVLLYSGLVMTEVLFYPIAACALLVIAYAVSSGTVRARSARSWRFWSLLRRVLKLSCSSPFSPLRSCSMRSARATVRVCARSGRRGWSSAGRSLRSRRSRRWSAPTPGHCAAATRSATACG